MTPNLLMTLDIEPHTLMWNGQAISLPGTYELAIHEIEDLVRELCHLWAAIGKIKEDRSPAPDLNAAAAQELGRNEGPASPPLPAEG